MLPREKRLSKEKDFKRVYQKGSFFSLGEFSINFLPNKTHVSRLGFVISKKVAAKATARNKIKRKFQAAAHSLYANLPSGYDVVVTVKHGAEKLEFSEIEKGVKKAFERIGG